MLPLKEGIAGARWLWEVVPNAGTGDTSPWVHVGPGGAKSCRGGHRPARGRLDAAGGGSQAAACPSLCPTHL